mgnify:FL=1
MSDTELMKKLLDGTLDPKELDNNPHLYVLAERIYGRESLEEMGILGPKVESYIPVDNITTNTSSVELPDYIPDINAITKDRGLIIKKRRKFILFLGITGLATVISNIIIGMGEILCSLGIANMKEICAEGNTQVVWLKGITWDGLHEIDTWKEPGNIEIFDISLIIIFAFMTLIGLFLKKEISTS